MSQISDFINKSRSLGNTDELIRQELRSAGWQEADIAQAFNVGITPASVGISTKFIAFIVAATIIVAGGAWSYFVNYKKSTTPVVPINEVSTNANLLNENRDNNIAPAGSQQINDPNTINNMGVINDTIVYNKYCLGEVKITYQNTDYSTETMTKLTSLELTELENNLINNVYPDNQIPSALQYVGLKLTRDNKIDEAFKIYRCAAEKYYDMFSMYRIASLYKYGTNEIQLTIPDVVIKNKVEPDLSKAYFWVTALIYVHLAEKGSLDPVQNQTDWNTIAMLDDLQSKLSSKEMEQIDTDVIKFISKRYSLDKIKQQPLYN